MHIKLTPLPTKAAKNTYKVVLTCMHGDADKFEDIVITCKGIDDFIRIMEAGKTQPLDGSSGGNEKLYRQWCIDNFGDGTVPRDCVYSSTGNLSKVDCINGFHYDENGIKWKAEVVA